MAEEKTFNILDPFSSVDLGIADSADGIKQWAISNREVIQPIKSVLNDLIVGIDKGLNAVPPLVMLALLVLIAWQAAGRRTAILVGLCMFGLGFLSPHAWGLAMTTLAIVVSAVILCFFIGLPLGVLAGKNDTFDKSIRPVLDTMQTIPAFVYLVPVVMLVGIGNVSGVIVTIIFALPPLVRLTSLGIRGVNPSVVEAARAFGANPRQILFKVEIPLATPTILAGVNQTIMLSLSMVVIASMISVKGLGNEVLRAMGRLDAGKAIVGGLGIVILAIVLDRITQGMGQSGRDRGHRHWWQGGPVGLVLRLAGKNP
ncbi:glycine betaine/proline transport system permease protein [Thalassovita litoralis]|jgi:glycine betaine/proline transport system permease protein|uniref:Glycine betaine/proline transport system permease protein n=1 Tax=Thalassovita litoralis TaxID=1010611 RepID=A0A521F4I6_9RHOB|nr:ABC transporter permease subunit [Thalassovita litoralis]SMO90936.1 glycine betaine/proline transport system permease protein [Thalassovita litoralis]